MDRINPHRVVGAAYFFTGVSLMLLGQMIGNVGYLIAVTLVAGLFTGAAQVSMPALAASFYPTRGRASGVAWMVGIGRFGGILGAVAGGALLQMGLSTVMIFGVLAIPAVIASAAVVYKDAFHRKMVAVA